jgi:hypothetical protein
MHKSTFFFSDELDPVAEKERLTYHDADEVSVVAWTLSGDEDFQALAEVIARADASLQRKRAEEIAKRYVPYRGVHRDWIIDLFLYGASKPRTGVTERLRPALLQTILADRDRRAVWADAELDELDARRARNRSATLAQGAQRLARCGAGRCIELNCPTRLANDKLQSRPRGMYCDAHEKALLQHVKSMQMDQIRQALDAATGRHKKSRAARRRNTAS